jgi:hypothetical protein
MRQRRPSALVLGCVLIGSSVDHAIRFVERSG